ncbi:MAG: LCP family protein [Tumebacillaceae bacterium]
MHTAEEQLPRLSLYEQAKRRSAASERAKTAKQAQTYLLLGVDSRRGEQARSDTILLAAVPQGGDNIRLMSIPRDTYTHVPGHGYTKINHAMSYGGVSLMKRTVEDFLNVPVDHVLTIDFQGFRKVVDELGGLDLAVEKNMDYDDPTDGTSIHLRQGQTIQSGKQALDYARFRHDAQADTGRMKRQQAVIRAIMQKGSQPRNWTKMFRFADIVGDHVKTDLPPGEWMRLAMTYADFRPEQLQTIEIAGKNRISPRDDLWYFFVDESDRRKVSRQLQELRRGNE